MRNTHSYDGPMNIYIETMLHADMLMISEYYKLLQIKDMSSQDRKRERDQETVGHYKHAPQVQIPVEYITSLCFFAVCKRLICSIN